ncbi:MarR family winged helix-turn-helix transcriptional regulator [Corynebacterium falsenii]|uniref:MarR family winged helix-turn-helix transcriptional regulator n=1 Tax=Corynebacterium falsenii TaxID=108486 RepID=UPI003FD28D25
MSSSAQELSKNIRALVGAYLRAFRTEPYVAEKLPPGQETVLAYLNTTPGLTSAELARLEHVRPQSMNKTVSQLREAGLVDVHQDTEDKRRHELRLTDAGATMLRDVRASRNDWLTQQLERNLTADERRQLSEALPLLDAVLRDVR